MLAGEIIGMPPFGAWFGDRDLDRGTTGVERADDADDLVVAGICVRVLGALARLPLAGLRSRVVARLVGDVVVAGLPALLVEQEPDRADDLDRLRPGRALGGKSEAIRTSGSPSPLYSMPVQEDDGSASISPPPPPSSPSSSSSAAAGRQVGQRRHEQSEESKQSALLQCSSSVAKRGWKGAAKGRVSNPARTGASETITAQPAVNRAAYHGCGPKWRNWQTRRTQNPVPFGACGFDSHLRHSSLGLRRARRCPDRRRGLPRPERGHPGGRAAVLRPGPRGRRRPGRLARLGRRRVRAPRVARDLRDPPARRDDHRDEPHEPVQDGRRRREGARKLSGRGARRPGGDRRRGHARGRRAAAPRGAVPRGRRAEDDRQRPRGDGLHVRLRHCGLHRDGGDRPAAHDGGVAQPRDGGRGDGPAHRLDRGHERHRRRCRRDPDPRAADHRRAGCDDDRLATSAGPTSRSSSSARATSSRTSRARRGWSARRHASRTSSGT